MATAAPEHNRDKVTKKVFFDMEVGGQPSGVFELSLVLKQSLCLAAAVLVYHADIHSTRQRTTSMLAGVAGRNTVKHMTA
jgi:hypothetical protein